MLSKIILPENFNYIGVFLTLRCNLGCDYCINKFGNIKQYKEITGAEWATGLGRLQSRPDLPITLQGGEPTMHEDFYDIVTLLFNSQYLDLLTNGLFDIDEFMLKVDQLAFKRPAPYASIRFSFHKNTNATGLAMKVRELQRSKYSVGIWGIDHPDMIGRNKAMCSLCKWLGIDYREKQYFDKDHGNYKYPDAVSGKAIKDVLCKPSELLIAPDGNIHRCHSDLYSGIHPLGNILDEDLKIENYFLWCGTYGLCNPCDVAIKTNRRQESGHTSVEIKETI